MRIAYKFFSAVALLCILVLACDRKSKDPVNSSNSEVKVASVSLDKTSAELEIGSDLSLVATVLPSNASNKKVTWSSSDNSIASVAEGKVTAIASGKAIITAKTEDGGKSATCEITVKAKPVVHVAEVALDKSTVEVEMGSEITLVATILPSDASNKKVTWSSSDNSIASVAEGKVTGVAVGKAIITAKSEDGDKTAACEVTVKEKPVVHVTGVTLDKTSAEVEIGPYVKYLTLNATVLPEDASDKSVTWSSSNKSVATVTEKGSVSIYKTGTAVITVKTVDGEKTATCTITVKAMAVVNVTGVEMYYKTKTVKVGEIFDIAATVSPGNATNRSVSWTPAPDGIIESYSGVYTYQPHGNVDKIYKAKAPGKVTITVKTSDGGFTDTCEVTVTE